MLSQSEPAASVEASWDSQILPNDVREALRRYYTDISPFASMLVGNLVENILYDILFQIHIQCSLLKVNSLGPEKTVHFIKDSL